MHIELRSFGANIQQVLEIWGVSTETEITQKEEKDLQWRRGQKGMCNTQEAAIKTDESRCDA